MFSLDFKLGQAFSDVCKLYMPTSLVHGLYGGCVSSLAYIHIHWLHLIADHRHKPSELQCHVKPFAASRWEELRTALHATGRWGSTAEWNWEHCRKEAMRGSVSWRKWLFARGSGLASSQINPEKYPTM